MQNHALFLLVLISLISFQSCEREGKNPDLYDFCLVKPEGWDCEIVQDNFELNDYPKNAAAPIAIVKYKNLNNEFTGLSGKKFNPSLVLDIYPIKQKTELNDFIKSQQMYSWCIPLYYGETKDYFILTSPCFINNGAFTEEANNRIYELHKSLKGIMRSFNSDLIEN